MLAILHDMNLPDPRRRDHRGADHRGWSRRTVSLHYDSGVLVKLYRLNLFRDEA